MASSQRARDRARARAILGAETSLDEGIGRQVLEKVAARRRVPANVVIDLAFPGEYMWRLEFEPAPAIIAVRLCS